MHLQADSLRNAFQVSAKQDRFGNNAMKIWGLIPLSIKISSSDTGGKLFLFQHENMTKGGPPRHIHHGQDEWFYAVKGEFAMEVGDEGDCEKFRLKAGDSFLAPRGIPHAWACISEPGTLITMVTPAQTFEEFIVETTKHPTLPSPEEIAAAFERHNMTVVGPPLQVD